jgi:ribosome-binding factor A
MLKFSFHSEHRFAYFCHMETQRQQKIGRLLQRDLSEIFQFDMKAIAAGSLVTVTKVTVSPDLSIAKVFLSLFGAKDKQVILSAIKLRSKEIRLLLGKRVRHQLRIIPDLMFFLDDSLDYIEHIDQLLHE